MFNRPIGSPGATNWASRNSCSLTIWLSRLAIEAASSFRDYEAGDYLQDAHYPPGDDPVPRDDDVHGRAHLAEVPAYATAEAKRIARTIR